MDIRNWKMFLHQQGYGIVDVMMYLHSVPSVQKGYVGRTYNIDYMG